MLFVDGPFDGRFLSAYRTSKPVPYEVSFTLEQDGARTTHKYKRANPIAGGFVFRYEGASS